MGNTKMDKGQAKAGKIEHFIFIHSIFLMILAIYIVGSEMHHVIYAGYRDTIVPYEFYVSSWVGMYLVGFILFITHIRIKGITWPYAKAGYYLLGFVSPRYRALMMLIDLQIGTSPGFIYIMRRSDGIYKLGRSDNPNKRLRQHQSDYGMKLELVKRFVVPDVYQFEKLALRLSSNYSYTEPGRVELRQMTTTEADEFIAKFKAICKEAVTR